MNAEDIALFESSKGKGKASNDSNNKKRESVLSMLLTETAEPFMTDVTHGAAWRELRIKFRKALEEIASRCMYTGYTNIVVEHKGGRTANVDFVVDFVGCGKANVEFKFSAVPQFVSLAANKPFHPELYAVHYYNNYLDKVIALYGLELEKPTLEHYLKYVYQDNYDKLPLFRALYNAEHAEKEASASSKFKSRQTAIVNESLKSYLEAQKDATDLSALTAEFQRTQKEKHYLIYEKGNFTYDRLEPEELVAASVAEIKGGNTLVIQTATPGTHIHMLLRWKNHQGILFPAWQVKMKREGAKKQRAAAPKKPRAKKV